VLASTLSPDEFASLREVATNPDRYAIPPDHGARLRSLGLIYGLVTEARITTAGRSRLASGIGKAMAADVNTE
jgi:hypothetical protein